MLYLVALFLAPLAVLLCWKPFQFLMNAVFWVLAVVALLAAGPLGFVIWLVPFMHAVMVVHNHYSDRRTQRIVDALREEGP